MLPTRLSFSHCGNAPSTSHRGTVGLGPIPEVYLTRDNSRAGCETKDKSLLIFQLCPRHSQPMHLATKPAITWQVHFATVTVAYLG